MIKDYFKISLREIRRRKIRSWLTLLGIFIGIAAIISLITLGQGLQNAISSQFQKLGNDKLFVTAKGNPLSAGLSTDAVKITTRDLEVVQRTIGVKRAAGMIYTTADVEFNDQVKYAFVMGMPTESEERTLVGEAQTWNIAKGRTLEKNDKYKVVLGHEYTLPDMLGKPVSLGDKIQIKRKEFKVVGLLEKIGSPPDDQSALIPLETYAELFDAKDLLGAIIIQTDAGEEPALVAEQVTQELRKYRGLKAGKEDFSIETPEQFAAAFSTILDIVQIVLIGIAGISLLVGGIGIMNTMYTSVLQRTKEIGVLKALGARNSHVLFLFLVESGLYGLGGGLIGVALGIGLAKAAGYAVGLYLGSVFLLVKIDLLLVFGALVFSFLIGCLSGIAPAWRASKLNPVDSLRYE